MTVKIEFLGHASFLVRSGSYTIAMDPFLNGNPVAKKSADEIECTHIVLSHGHADHIADAGPIAKRRGATVFGAFEICNFLGETHGLEKLEPMNPGGQVKTDFGFVALTRAYHSSSFDGRYMGMPCGVILSIGGKTIYHSGDTALFSDMKLIGELYRPDVALLCAGDRFTMGPEHAARAAEWVGAPVAVPMHYGTWPLLTSDMSGFKPRGVEARIMKPGEVMTVG
ncbi:MAG: metal-dependent hydrolase [Phycisphaeraceae bacterium]|nr:MAG: metal-dependent hydrolase [Phycisphaeraceae bacterium]